ncbi:MAG: molybdopterin molybdotransferase MoeA [Dethiobacter sp.]|jgi:molybdopterin molybdotransferase|nr:molybdopterin molybdotransferase MoeA [Dethiobacter sp.]
MLTVLTVIEAREKILSGLGFRLPAERVLLADAAGRVLAGEITAPSDLPAFSRSTMDGYAVAARDSFGATEAMPALLDVTGEVMMGTTAPAPLKSGEAMRISTGGMLPAGADAVVMVEHTELLDEYTVSVHRAAAPGENTIARGEDLRQGVAALPPGHILRPQDIGLLAALGCTGAEVATRPRVAVLSTGDELVSPECEPAPGQVRDINTYLLSALVKQTGAVPVPLGIIPDSPQALAAALHKTKDCDCTIISGGSSAGVRDLTADAINSLGKPGVLFHGVSMRPGKPLIYGLAGDKPYFGLSGNPTSAMVGFLLFVRPLLLAMQGASELQQLLWARVDRSLSSAGGREDYVRAILYSKERELWASPVLGQSNLISTVVRGSALLRIPQDCEGVEAGEKLEAIEI